MIQIHVKMEEHAKILMRAMIISVAAQMAGKENPVKHQVGNMNTHNHSEMCICLAPPPPVHTYAE